jgi:hypothetical protein
MCTPSWTATEAELAPVFPASDWHSHRLAVTPGHVDVKTRASGTVADRFRWRKDKMLDAPCFCSRTCCSHQCLWDKLSPALWRNLLPSQRMRLPSRELLCLTGRHLFGQSILQRRAQGVCTSTMVRSSKVEAMFTVFAVSDLAPAGSCRPFVPGSHSAMSISSPSSARYNVPHCTRNVPGMSSSEVHSLGWTHFTGEALCVEAYMSGWL